MLDRRTGGVTHADVRNIARFLKPGDVMVFNDTRVFPARLIGEREPGGGAVEVMLVSRLDDERWEALVHPGQRMRPGAGCASSGAAARFTAKYSRSGSSDAASCVSGPTTPAP